MTTAGLRDLGRDLERLFREGSHSGASDARLLERFVSDGDAPAFEALVARHRDMLLRTCLDLLGDAADAEEAFQATVVILWRRAGSIREKEAVGGWLHHVACRVARRTRVGAARRRAGEGRAVAIRARESISGPDPDPLVRDELRKALHDEIDRLPDRYRRPVIACLLEGMTQEQAAARLDWTEGSVRGRLARGKARLRDRLTRRGIALAAVLAGLAEPGPAAAATGTFLAILRTKAVISALSALLAMGVVVLAIAMRADGPRQPAVRAASAPIAPPPKDEPEPEILASFRGGGPTNESRATALPPEIAARTVEFLGRVLDPSGKGVAGARLSLVTDAWSDPQPQAVSEIDGTFRFKKTVGDFWRNFAAGGSDPARPGRRPRDAQCVRHRLGQPPGRGERRQARDRRGVSTVLTHGRRPPDRGSSPRSPGPARRGGRSVGRAALRCTGRRPLADHRRAPEVRPRALPENSPADRAVPLRSVDGDPHRGHGRRRPVHAQGRWPRPPRQPRRDRPGDGPDAMDRPESRRSHRGDEGRPRPMAAHARPRRPDRG